MSKSPSKIGKGNTLLYALVVSVVLGWQSIDISRTRDDGWSFRSKQVPVEILTPCLVFLGVALGVNIGEAIASIGIAVSRNSAAINALLTKNNISPKTLEPTELTSDEKDGNSEL